MAFAIITRLISLLLHPWLGKCTGIENISKVKGAILCANHASYLDHFIIGSRVVRKAHKTPYFLAKKEHFDTPLQKAWHTYLRAIPVDRESGGKEALSKAIEHLNKGHLIMIYPEGTRTLTGEMNRAKTGIARLALAAKVPVIPMGLTNTFNILPKGKKFPKFGFKSDLYIGKPMYFDNYYGMEEDKDTLRKITTLIMKEIAKLAKTKYSYD